MAIHMKLYIVFVQYFFNPFRIAATVDRPLCTCGAHVTWSRHRFAMLNDRQRSRAFRQALKQVNLHIPEPAWQ